MSKPYLILALALLAPTVAQASYVNDCRLSVRILEQTVQMSATELRIKVLGAAKAGRADSGCQQYVNQVMIIPLAQPEPPLKAGQRAAIRLLTTDSRLQPEVRTQFEWW